MNHLITFKSNLKKLNIFAKKLAKISKTPDIILLQGELGTGKTTFARYFINALFYKMNIPLPFSIKSPTFPIMISYDLNKYEVNHYDLYRLIKTKELDELNIFENFYNNISIIEWPEILIKRLTHFSYYKIQFSFVDEFTRNISISHSNKKMDFF